MLDTFLHFLPYFAITVGVIVICEIAINWKSEDEAEEEK